MVSEANIGPERVGFTVGTENSRTQLARRLESPMALASVIDFVIRNRIYLWPFALLVIWACPAWYGSTPSWNAVPSITLAAVGLYQLNRLSDVVEDEINDPGAYARVSAMRAVMRGTAILAIGASLVGSVVLMNLVATGALSVVLLLGTLYSVPILRREHGNRLRLKQFPALKNAVPSLVWPMTTILYPAIPHSGLRLVPLLLAMTCLSCFVFTIEVAWDIRDMRGDQAAEIKTLATTFGVDGALVFPRVAGGIQALILVVLIAAGAIPTLWLLPAALLVLLPNLAVFWRHSLAVNGDRSHLLVCINAATLIPIYLVGRWAV